MPTTQPDIAEELAARARARTSADWDVCQYAGDVYEGVKHMLEAHVSVSPAEPTDEDRETMRILLDDYLGFYLMANTWDLGGSAVDYCTSCAWDALEGYVVNGYEDVEGMLSEIAPAMEHALRPEEIASELSSIGIA